MGHPLAMVRLYFGDKLMQVVEDANFPQEPYNDFYRIWKWFIDLQTAENDLASKVAAMTATNLPTRFSSLDATLRTALVGSGLCCQAAADALIASIVMEWKITTMEREVPGFNREWLTIQGAETHRETLLEPGVRQESWPNKPAPQSTKRLSKDTAQVILRGKP